MNVARGGSLVQDIAHEFPAAIKHDYFPIFGFSRDHIAHPVGLVGGSRLHRTFTRDEIRVNSMHHQGIKRLGDGWEVTGVAPDGLPEAIESRNGSFAIGVQWHPEVFETHDPQVLSLFRSFVDAAR